PHHVWPSPQDSYCSPPPFDRAAQCLRSSSGQSTLPGSDGLREHWRTMRFGVELHVAGLRAITDDCSNTGSLYRVRGSGRFLYRIMHVEDAPPASGILSAHGHPMSGAVILGGIKPEIVGVPQGVAEAAYVTRPYVIVQFGSKLEVTLAQ